MAEPVDRQVVMLRALADVLTGRIGGRQDVLHAELRDFVQQMLERASRGNASLAVDSARQAAEPVAVAMRALAEAQAESNRLLAKLIEVLDRPRPALELKRADGSKATIREVK